MTFLYTDEDYLSVLAQKRRLFAIYLVVLGAYLALGIACICTVVSLPYHAPAIQPLRWVISIATVAFVFFSYPYLGIKYKRVRKYCAMVSGFASGLKDEDEGEFYGFYEGTQKDGVDVDLCLLRKWNEKKRCYDERQYYIDREKPVPPFRIGDRIYVVLQGNVLIGYEIIEKGEEA